MKRLLILLLVLTACAGMPKQTETRVGKCAETAGMVWRYDHTEYWTTEEAVYEYHWNWQSGEYEWGYNGTETVEHSQDVYDCLPRR